MIEHMRNERMVEGGADRRPQKASETQASGSAASAVGAVQEFANNGAKAPVKVLDQLARLCGARGLERLGGEIDQLAALGARVDQDLARIEREIGTFPREDGPVSRTANHLIDLAGKRLRPLLVAVIARLGGELTPAAVELAVAVELVHSATLLHDDVVDLGAIRRGAPTARLVYGNAASIFAGDWLLVDALRRVRKSRIPGVLDTLLAVIEEMIRAESIQLETRGQLVADRATYFRILDGKTASLFRWAAGAGGRAANLSPEVLSALERYGSHLGIAFQVVDDVLDLTGDAVTLKKSLLVDLEEGKLTYPILIGLERDPEILPTLEELSSHPIGASFDALAARVLASLSRTGAVEAAMDFARSELVATRESLAPLPRGEVRTLLELIAEAAVGRAG